MLKQIKVKDLCAELEEQLIQLGYSEDSMRRYRKVFNEFIEYANDCEYSQSIGTNFLVEKFKLMGGFVLSGENSKNEIYYFRVIRSLAEYYNFRILFRRHDFKGEIIWPKPYKEVTENFIKYKIEYGRFQRYIEKIKSVVKDLIIFLDASQVHELNGITSELLSKFINSFSGFTPSTIAWKISILREYFKYAYLNKYIDHPVQLYLPHTPQKAHLRLPTVWTQEQINNLLKGVDTTNPVGKRDYAMMLIAARLGMRIGDIRNLKLTNIDWDNKKISIIQSKTKNPLTLPLPNDVGWAIIDYLKNGRPITKSENIFVVHNPPYIGKPIQGTLRENFSKALIRANIHVEKQKRCGWHSLRHSIATNLLQNGVDSSIISDILGHSDPGIVKHYIKVNRNGLKKCVLEVEVKKNVK